MTLKEIPPIGSNTIHDIRSLNNSNFNISSSRYNEGERSQGNVPSNERPVVASVQSRLEQVLNGIDSPIHAQATELGDMEAL